MPLPLTLALAAAAQTLNIETPVWAFDAAAIDQFAWSTASAGDVNGDGYGDLIVGAPGDDPLATDLGSAYVFLGSADGVDATAVTKLVPSIGGWPDVGFGTAVASAGDVDGDGYDDVIVGAPRARFGGLDPGGAYVYRGSATGIDPSTEQFFSLIDVDHNGEVGSAVAGVGDVDADGYDDVVVAAEWTDAGAGAAYVLRGGPNGLDLANPTRLAPDPAHDLSALYSNPFFGAAVAGGDVDGDGWSDVVVGAPGDDVGGVYDAGGVYVFFGGPGGVDPSTWTYLTSSDPGDGSLGRSLAVVDVDGDAVLDVVAGAWDLQGKLCVFTGGPDGPDSSRQAHLAHTSVGTLFAEKLTGCDVDGDGYAEVISGGDSYAYVLFGSATGLDPASEQILTSPGILPNEDYGFSVGCADVDGEGTDDALIGAVYANIAVAAAGAVYVYQTCTDTFYEDADADGYGSAAVSTVHCVQPDGFVATDDDCDDTSDAISPEAVEVCDGIDQDCDDAIDEDAIDAPTWYADQDGDGAGDREAPTVACDAPPQHVADPQDCDDADPAVHTGAQEVCDGVDNDCDGAIDLADCDEPEPPEEPDEVPPAVEPGLADPDEKEGCGCASSGGASGALVVLAALALRRRGR